MLRLILLAWLISLSVPVLAQQAPARSQSAVSQTEDIEIRAEALLRLVSDSQAYFLKPTAFGGGGQSFEGVSLEALEYSIDGLGQHVRTPSGTDATHVYALMENDGMVLITATSDRHDNVLRAIVWGPTLEDIAVNF
jgi:hypothetical protein